MQLSCSQCGEKITANTPCTRCGFSHPAPARSSRSLGAPLAVYFHPILAFLTAIPAAYSLVPDDYTEALIYRFAAGFFLLFDLLVFMDVESMRVWCEKHALLRWINGIAFLVPGASLIYAGLPMVINIVVALFKDPLVLVDAWWYLLGFGSICAIGVMLLLCAFDFLFRKAKT